MPLTIPPKEKPVNNPVVVKPMPAPVDLFQEDVARLSKALIEATPEARAKRLAELRVLVLA